MQRAPFLAGLILACLFLTGAMCPGMASGFLYSQLEVEISLRREDIQTADGTVMPRGPTPWCLSVGYSYDTRVVAATLTLPATTSLPSNTLAFGETVRFATLEELEAAVPPGQYRLDMERELTPGEPPTHDTYQFEISEPFPFTNDTIAVLGGNWIDGSLHCHEVARIVTSQALPYEALTFTRYTFMDPSSKSTGVQVGGPGSSVRLQWMTTGPGAYRVAQSFLHEIHSDTTTMAVLYEVRTLFDLALHPDPAVLIDFEDDQIKVHAVHTIPDADYQLWTADQLTGDWTPQAPVTATGTVHQLDAQTGGAPAQFFRLGKS